MIIMERKTSEITPYPGNPRRYASAIDAVAESIRRFGFRQPLVVDASGVIVCGHTRYEAAKRLGLESVPCVSADDLSDDAIRAYRLLDNKLHEKSDWDYEALAQELADFDYDFSAFDVCFDPPSLFDDRGPELDQGSDPPHPREPPCDAREPPESYEIVVKCEDENDQKTLYDRLVAEGYNVRLCNI